MLPDDNPPVRLEEFRAFAEEYGQTVRREYFWGGEYTDEDGELQYSEPGWETLLVKEAKQDDGRIVVHYMQLAISDFTDFVWPEKWKHLVELNEMGFERTLEEHGYSRPRDSG